MAAEADKTKSTGTTSQAVTNKSNNTTTQTDTKERTVTLTLQQFDIRSKSASPKSRVVLPEKYRDASLQHIRWYLIQQNRLPKEYINNKFCDKDGADVPDDVTFNAYTEMNGESKGDAFNVYYLTASIWTGMDDHTAAFLKDGLDLKLSERMPFLKPSLDKLASSFKLDTWKASAGTPDTHPADMNEAQWGIVIRNNDLLNGKFFEGGGTNDKLAVPTGIRRARHTAFALKERAIPEYNISFKVEKDTPPGVAQPQVKFRIPRFQICDGSRVEVFETKSSIANSMACNAFSQTTVEASAGGGVAGISVGVKAGATTSESSSYAQSSAKDESRMHVAYLFPRVEVFFDVDDLELTAECKSDLEKVKDKNAKKEDADNFFLKYGHIFVPDVQLGGRLHSVETTSSIAGTTMEQKSSALKAAASASVSGFGYQASVSGSHESTKDSKVEKSYSSLSHSITWHADGGDTLLCNNPPAWCPTVHSYYNWRVMNQIGMIDIVQLIGKMEGYDKIPQRFEDIYFQSVQFKICMHDSTSSTAPPFLGMVGNEEILERPHAAGGNFSRRAKRHALQKCKEPKEHMNTTLEILALKHHLVWEGTEGTTPRFRYGVRYPLRFCSQDKNTGERTIYGVRRTTLAEYYQKENVLYAGLNEEPNVLVMFRKIGDDGAAARAERIGSTDRVRMDFYDLETKTYLGWLQNDPAIAHLQPGVDPNPFLGQGLKDGVTEIATFFFSYI